MLSKIELSSADILPSKAYFESRQDDKLVPRPLHTLGIVLCLPFPITMRFRLEKLWKECIRYAGKPRAFGVKSHNRHIELFLLRGPKESPIDANAASIQNVVKSSREILEKMEEFEVELRFPFLTPDGVLVAPGYDNPTGTVTDARSELRTGLNEYSERQSQWFHTSLGRILEPLRPREFQSLISFLEERWNTVIGRVRIKKLLWTYETRWYMEQKNIITELTLRKPNK